MRAPGDKTMTARRSLRSSHRLLRRHLTLTTALTGLMLTPGMAVAQVGVVLGTKVSSGGATPTVANTGTLTNGTTTVTLNAQNTVVDWATLNVQKGSIAGVGYDQTLNFVNNTAVDKVAVLNRVAAGTTVISGSVNGLNSVTTSRTSDTRGTEVWISNPNGLVIGNGAAFNTAGLVLTTLPIGTIGDDGTAFLATSSTANPTGVRLVSASPLTDKSSVTGSGTYNIVTNGGVLAVVAPVVQLAGAGTFDARDAAATPGAGQAAFVAATDVMMQNAGSPLSVTIKQGTTLAVTGNNLDVSGTVRAGAVLMVVSAQQMTDTLLNVRANVTATADSGNGVVIIAGNAATNIDAADSVMFMPTTTDAVAGTGRVAIGGAVSAAGAGVVLGARGTATTAGSGAISETGSITARTLSARSFGSLTLDSATNVVQQTTALASGGTTLRLTNTGALTVGGSGISGTGTGAGRTDVTLVTGAGALTLQQPIATTGLVDLNGAGGITLAAATPAAPLSLAGTSVTFRRAVTLAGDAVVTSTGAAASPVDHDVTFLGAINGGYALGVSSAGTKTFVGNVGADTALTSLTTSGGTTSLQDNVRTSGGQSYDAATLAGTGVRTLTSTSGGAIAFTGTVEAAAAGSQGLATRTTGITSFAGTVGQARALASVAITGAAAVNGGAVTTSGDAGQTYGAAATIGADTALSSGAGPITITGALNGGFALAVNSTGATSFGAIGDTAALTSLATDGGGTTTLLGHVTTSGTQTYGDTVRVGSGSRVLTSTGRGNITFNGTLDFGPTISSLAINTGGVTSFNAAVGGQGTTGRLSTGTTGTTTVNADITAASTMFGNAVTITGARTITGGVTFASTVAGPGDLTLSGDSYKAAMLGLGAGTGVTPLESLTVNGNALGALYSTGDIATTGAHIYNTSLYLGEQGIHAAHTTTLRGSTVAFNGGSPSVIGVSGERLALEFTGAITLNPAKFRGFVGLRVGPVGGTNGATTTLAAGTFRYDGDVLFNDATTLGGDVGIVSNAGTVAFARTVDGSGAGGQSLTVDTGGATSFGGAVGGGVTLGNLTTDAGGTTSLAGNVTTTGAQTYRDAVTLVGDRTLTASGAGASIAFSGGVDGTGDITLAGAGTKRIAGGATPTTFGSLLTTGGAITVSGDITTTGSQTYQSGLILGSNATLTGSGAGATFAAAGGVAGGGRDLTLMFAGGQAIDGTVANVGNLTTQGSGTTRISGTIQTNGRQFYNTVVRLTNDTLLSSQAGDAGGNSVIELGGTVDGSFNLGIQSNGTARFNGVVGGQSPLASLTATFGGVLIAGPSITTSGTQSYGLLTLLADTVLKGTGIDFAGGVIGNGGGVAHDLTLTTTGARTIRGNLTGIRNLSVGGGGGTDLSGIVATAGTQTYADAVRLAATSTLSSGGNGDIGFGSTIVASRDGAAGLFITTAGQTSFNGAVGGSAGGANRLQTLQVGGSGTTVINTDSIVTLGGQRYNGLTLARSARLLDLGGGDIVYTGTVIASAGGGQTLETRTGGQVRFLGLVGGRAASATRLCSLTVESGNATIVGGGGIYTIGAQSYLGSPVTLTADTVLSGSTVSPQFGINGTSNGIARDLTLTTTGPKTINSGFTGIRNLVVNGGGAITLSGTVSTSGTQTYTDAVTLAGQANAVTSIGGGAITFASTVDATSQGVQSLSVNTAGVTSFIGAIGAGVALGTLTTDAGGSTLIAGGLVRTVGDQTYNDGLRLGSDTMFRGDLVVFNNGVNGNTGGIDHDLTLDTTNYRTVNGALIGIRNLVAQGNAYTNLSGAISTSGAQTYASEVRLTGATTLNSTGASDIRFGGRLSGGFALAVNTAGITAFDGVIGLIGPASASLTTGNAGRTLISGGVVTTSGDQSYGNAVTLGTTTTLNSNTGGAIAFAQTIDGIAAGGQGLIVNTAGATRFGGAVGSNVTLASVATDAVGTTEIRGGVVTTIGTQGYADRVLLGADTVLTGGSVVFGSGVVGNFSGTDRDLTLTTTGAKAIDTAFTGIRNLVANGGGATTLAGTITTSGTQFYADPVTLAAATTVASTAGGVGGNADITLGGTVNGATAVTVRTAGTTTIAGVVGGIAAPTSLDVLGTGSTLITTTAVTTTGAQNYAGRLVVGGIDQTVLRSSGGAGIGFGGAIDGASVGVQRLVVTTTGTATFNGSVGAVALRSLQVTEGAGTTRFNADIGRVTGLLTFNGGLVLGRTGADTLTTLTSTGGGAITVGGQVSALTAGGQALAVGTAGATIFGGAIGLVPLASLVTDAGGTTSFANGLVTTTGAQVYNDAVSLEANTSFIGSTVAFSAGVAGDGGGVPHDLTVTTTGPKTIDGGFTGIRNLLANGGGAITLSGPLTTTGTQRFADAVTLASAGGSDTVALASSGNGAITFGATIDAAAAGVQGLSVATGGATEFVAAVGASRALSALTTDAPGITTLAANVTAAAQRYGDAVAIGAGTQTLTAASSLAFARTVDGPGGLVLAGVGTKNLAGATGGVTPLASLTITGGVATLGSSVTTVGLQDYGTGVLLSGDAALRSTGNADIAFAASIDAASAGGPSLVIATGGVTRFGGAVGGNAALASLATKAGGSTRLDGGLVRTTGSQVFGNQLVLGADTTLAGTTASFVGINGNDHDLTLNLSAQSSLDGGTITGIRTLTTDAGGGTILSGGLTTSAAQIFNDRVTLAGTTTLTATTGAFNGGLTGQNNDLTLNFSSTSTLDGSITGVRNLVTDAAGTTVLRGALSTSDTQSFGDAVVLASDTSGDTVTLTSRGNGAIRFDRTIDATTASVQGLSIATGGTIGFSGPVGGQTALSSLTTGTAGTTVIGASITAATQAYGNAVLIGTGTQTLTAANTLAFARTVDGPGALVLAGAGDKRFADVIGGGLALASLSASGGATTLGGNVITVANQNYGSGVVLGRTLTTTSTRGGDISFVGTLDAATAGAQGLTVATGGATRFASAVGGTNALARLETDAGGTTAINGGSVLTTGAQSYGDAVTLGTAATLASSGNAAIAFASTVDGPGALTVRTSGTTSFAGAVGGVGLASLTTDAGGATLLNGGPISTIGAQTFGDAVLLGADTTLTATAGGAITLAGTVDGARRLAINTAGTTTLGGTIGGAAGGALLALVTDAPGATVLAGGTMVAAVQSYADSVTLAADTRLIGTTTSFGGNVDGNRLLSLTLTDGVQFNGVIGGVTPLTGLAVRAGSFAARAGNRVGTVAASVAGGFAYDDAAALTVGTIDGLTGIDTGPAAAAVSAGGKLTLATEISAGNVSLAGSGIAQAPGTGVDAGAGTILLNGNAGELTLAGLLTTTNGSASAVRLTRAGDATLGTIVTGAGGTVTLGLTGDDALSGRVMQGAGSTITAGTLAGSIDGTATLTNAGNSIGTLGAFTASGLSIRSSGTGLTVAGPVDARSGNLSLALDAGTLVLAGNLAATSGTVTLTSGGAINQTAGGIVADTLIGSSVGGASLASTANRVARLGGFTNTAGDRLAFNAGRALVLTGDARSAGDLALIATGIDFSGRTVSASGSASLNAGNGDVTGATVAAGGDLSIIGAGVTLGIGRTDGGALTLAANGTGRTLTLGTGTAGGAVVLTSAGAITVGEVLTAGTSVAINAVGAATLGQSSAGANLAVTANGIVARTTGAGSALTLTSSGDITAGTTSAGTALTFAATGAITAGASSAGGALSLTSGAGITLASGKAGTDASIDANGTAALGAVTAGAASTITVGALDATISGAQTAGRMVLVNRSPATATLRVGSDTKADGFRLSQEEINFVTAGSLTFDGGTGGVELGTLVLNGAAGSGNVAVLATGRIDVTGAVSASGVGRGIRIGGTATSTDDKASVIEVTATATGGGRLLFDGADLKLQGARIGIGQSNGFLTPIGFDGVTGQGVAAVSSAYVANPNSSLYNPTLGGTPYQPSGTTLVQARTLTVRFTDYALIQNTGMPGSNGGVVLGGTTAQPVSNALNILGLGTSNAFALFGTINGINGTGTALLGQQVIGFAGVDLVNARVNGCLVGSGAGCLTSVVSQPVLNVFDSSRLNVFRSADDLVLPFDPVVGSNNEALFSGSDASDGLDYGTDCTGSDDPACRQQRTRGHTVGSATPSQPERQPQPHTQALPPSPIMTTSR